MEIAIPKRIRKIIKTRNGVPTEVHNYVFVSESTNVLVYKCLENGTKECFQKKDFAINTGTYETGPYKGAKIE